MLHRTATCKAKKIKEYMLSQSGLFGKDTEETFAAAKVDRYNRELYAYLQWKWNRKKWLYLYHQANGTGKSYTANAIANMLIAEGFNRWLCERWIW